MAFRRGDVVRVPFPYTNLSQAKTRPAVVISGKVYHAAEPDLIFAAITSQIPHPIGPMDYVLTGWQRAGLKKPSALKIVLFTLEPSLIVHRIGQLTPTDMAGVDTLLRRALDL